MCKEQLVCGQSFKANTNLQLDYDDRTHVTLYIRLYESGMRKGVSKVHTQTHIDTNMFTCFFGVNKRINDTHMQLNRTFPIESVTLVKFLYVRVCVCLCVYDNNVVWSVLWTILKGPILKWNRFDIELFW